MWLHAGNEPVDVTLPEAWADSYLTVFRSDTDGATDRHEPLAPGSTVTLIDHTFALFEAVTPTPPAAEAQPTGRDCSIADRAADVEHQRRGRSPSPRGSAWTG